MAKSVQEIIIDEQFKALLPALDKTTYQLTQALHEDDTPVGQLRTGLRSLNAAIAEVLDSLAKEPPYIVDGRSKKELRDAMRVTICRLEDLIACF